MNSIKLVISLFLFSLLCSGQTCEELVTGLIPLKSTRGSVERKLGKSDKIDPGVYHTKKAKVRVNYIKQKCIGNGWNVLPSTVLDYYVFPKNRVLIEEYRKDYINLTKTVDDAFYSFYTDKINGVQYVVASDGSLAHIRYFPRLDDGKYRCDGYYEFDPVSETYLRFDRFRLETNPNTLARIDSALGSFADYSNYVLYMVFYLRSGEDISRKQEILSTIEQYVYEERNLKHSEFKAIFGGFRDDSEAEIFILPRDYSKPVPNPKYACPYPNCYSQ